MGEKIVGEKTIIWWMCKWINECIALKQTEIINYMVDKKQR